MGEGRRATCKPVSPHIYRSLVRAAQPVVKAADPGAEVVIGELAPVGNKPISVDTPMRAARFLRSLGCVDDKYKTIKTGRCKGFKAAEGDTLGYHPHPQKLRARPREPGRRRGPVRRPPAPVHARIDKLRARKRLQLSKTIHLTEFGYETSPPDQARRASRRRCRRATCSRRPTSPGSHQARARACPSTSGTTSRSVNLGSGTKRYSGWQTGLRFNDGTPEAGALDVPGAVRDRAQAKADAGAAFWGQVAPEAQGQVTLMVQAARARPSSRTSAPINDRAPTASGRRKLKPQTGAAYRYAWTPGRR